MPVLDRQKESTTVEREPKAPDAFVDSRDCKLMVWIGHDNEARTHATVSREDAARMLRYIADQFDPRTT